jgi:hypothetical protein
MKIPKINNETVLRLAREEENCNISAGSLEGVFVLRETSHSEALLLNLPLTQSENEPA